jgi:hypothetical protein
LANFAVLILFTKLVRCPPVVADGNSIAVAAIGHGHGYSETENLMVFIGYVATSEDPIKGNYQGRQPLAIR